MLLNQQITDFSKRFIFIYAPKQVSILQDLHTAYGGIFLEYDSKMGQRFSTFTTPHLLVAALTGMDLEQLFNGANDVLNNFRLADQSFISSLYSGALFLTYGF